MSAKRPRVSFQQDKGLAGSGMEGEKIQQGNTLMYVKCLNTKTAPGA